MKIMGITQIFLGTLLIFAGSAWSLSIDVGSLDTLIAGGFLKNSGDQTEVNWVKGVLNADDITLEEKYDVTSGEWFRVYGGQAGTWAIHFLTEAPEYFLVKTGKISGSCYDHFLFKNNPNMSWGVINLPKQLGITSIANVAKISHVDEFNGAPVPEPATIMLLGAGLIGLARFARKAKQ